MNGSTVLILFVSNQRVEWLVGRCVGRWEGVLCEYCGND